jgi:hypothetical protein
MARALSAALGAEGNAAVGLALSRLPEVPSMFAPMHASGVFAHGPPTAMQQAAPMTSASQPPGDIYVGPGGTLASPLGHSVTVPPPQVVAVGAHGTLPSENLPMFSAHAPVRRGVAPWLVIVLVASALIAGFLLGFAIARAH